MSDDWWGGGGESGGPSDADMRARGYEWSESGDGGGWVFTGKFPKTIAGTGIYAGDTWEAGKGYELGYLPQDFDWQKYINAPSNEDLRRAGIDTKVEAERHFALYGRSENRAGLPDWYNKDLEDSRKIFESGEIYNPKAGQVLGYVYELPNGERTVNKESGGKPIAIYEPPFVIDYDAKRPLTPTEKYNVVAQAAGAVDAPVEWGMGKGVLNAGYMNPKLEAAFKAPGEIQTFSNIDPTKSDWAVQSANVTLPQKSKKWYQEVMSSPIFGLGLMALGVPAGLSNILGGGSAGAVGAGALLGGAQAAATGGDFLKGALTGGATGGFGAAAAPIVGEIVGSAGLSGAAADIAKAAAISAGKAAITGGDPLQAALAAAVGTGVGGTVSQVEALKDLDPAIAKAVTAAATGAARAAVTGGDPIRSALMGVADAGLNAALGSLSPTTQKPAPEAKPETPAPVEFEYGEAPIFDIIDPEKIAATPTEKWIDQGFLVNEATPSIESLLAELGQQEEEQAGMQSAVLGYDPRLMEALQAGEAEQAAMVAALAQPSTAAATKPAVATAAPKAAIATPAPAPAPAPAAQSPGMDFGSLLALLGAAQQPQKEPPPIPVVGEIKPYEFSSDLLAGVYGKPRANMYGANEELLNMMRGS